MCTQTGARQIGESHERGMRVLKMSEMTEKEGLGEVMDLRFGAGRDKCIKMSEKCQKEIIRV